MGSESTVAVSDATGNTDLQNIQLESSVVKSKKSDVYPKQRKNRGKKRTNVSDRTIKNNAFRKRPVTPEKRFHITNDKYICVSNFGKELMIHIRQFYKDRQDRLRPTKRGFTMTQQEWKSLTEYVADVNYCIEQMK